MPENVIEAPVVPLNTTTGSVAPSSAGTINVIPQPITAAPAPAPGTKKSALFDRMRSKSKIDGKPVTPPKPEAPAKPAEPSPVAAKVEAAPEANGETHEEPEGSEINLGEDLDDPRTTTAPVKEGETKPAEAKDKGKVNPWKLVDEYKERVKKVEVEALELRKLIPNEEARKKEMGEVESLRKRAAELESEIRHVNFTKSEEFKTKFEAPYQKAWENAMSDVSQIMITDANGERPATANDIMKVVNLPLGEARKVADEMFGPFANDVMGHRKEIQRLYQEQTQALESFKKQGEQVQQERVQKMQQLRETVQKEVVTSWQEFNTAAAKDKKFGKFFTPQEGDTEGNTRLEKGFKLVDDALARNPMDPRLTPEQRREAVRMQTAVRNRAAAFGRLTGMVISKDARIAALEAELKQYKTSEPDAGGRTTQTQTTPVTGREGLNQRLRSLAK